MKALLPFFLLILSAGSVLAQASDIEMADNFRAEGKIYIVVAVILVILIGLFVYLIRLDKKLTKLENSHEKNHSE